MNLAQVMLQEFDREARNVRAFLERVPEDKLTWRPHEKSMTLGQLAFHIAQSIGFVTEMASSDRAQMPDFSNLDDQPTSMAPVLELFDQSVAAVKRTLPTFDQAAMAADWSISQNGQPIMAMPRAQFLRSILFNHTYHHRGQLSVYLRLLDQSVPSAYGPTADEVPEEFKGMMEGAS